MTRGWTNPDLTARPDTPRSTVSAFPGYPVPAESFGVPSSLVDHASARRVNRIVWRRS
jgi:hypothetical protein